MSALQIILGVLLIISSILIIVVVLLQESRSSGLSEHYSKNQNRLAVFTARRFFIAVDC